MSFSSDFTEVVLLGTALAAAHNGGFLFEALLNTHPRDKTLRQSTWAVLTLCICTTIVHICIPYALAAVLPKQKILIFVALLIVCLLGWSQGNAKR